MPRTIKLPFILSCRCLRGDSAGCYPCLLPEHLPSTTEASPIFQHNSAACKATKFTESGLPGCPRTKVRGGKSGQTHLFPASRQDHLTTPGRQIFSQQGCGKKLKVKGKKSGALRTSASHLLLFTFNLLLRRQPEEKKMSKSPRCCPGQLVPGIVGFGVHRAQPERDLLVISRYGILSRFGRVHPTLLGHGPNPLESPIQPRCLRRLTLFNFI